MLRISLYLCVLLSLVLTSGCASRRERYKYYRLPVQNLNYLNASYINNMDSSCERSHAHDGQLKQQDFAREYPSENVKHIKKEKVKKAAVTLKEAAKSKDDAAQENKRCTVEYGATHAPKRAEKVVEKKSKIVEKKKATRPEMPQGRKVMEGVPMSLQDRGWLESQLLKNRNENRLVKYNTRYMG